ncbi:unnamed protein product [Didymodactylos carnosus]|uniref:Uncharacterized protein n=1 Tax=Didymodactylos carnosus TaxID=1234261 RepID=A0A8S2VYM1_9BILA|nr:unnamed protein product [Didymodactylos carnosus]
MEDIIPIGKSSINIKKRGAAARLGFNLFRTEHTVSYETSNESSKEDAVGKLAEAEEDIIDTSDTNEGSDVMIKSKHVSEAGGVTPETS